jgi:hypothetical protein
MRREGGGKRTDMISSSVENNPGGNLSTLVMKTRLAAL